jgi:hypothetical protein
MNQPHAYLVAARIAGAIGVAVLAAPAHADIFRCVDPAGEVSYSDMPCPAGHALSANITESVQACTTPECQAQMERARASAEERLRAERAALNDMQDRRLRTEELDLQRQLQLQQMDRLETLEAQLAAQRAADSGVYYPGYPLYPGGFGDPGFGKAGHRPCAGAACGSRPERRPGAHRKAFREPSVNVIAPGPRRTRR